MRRACTEDAGARAPLALGAGLAVAAEKLKKALGEAEKHGGKIFAETILP